MQRDAHYYATMAFCRACGFDKESAHVVAYAAQFVDEAKINLIFFNPSDQIIEHEIVEDKPAFFNMATCHSYTRIKTFNYEAMVNNTAAFHFVPGCDGDNFTKKLRCKEQSPIIINILNDVIMEGDLIKLGIVLHVYVDTFSHQGFSGLLSKVNDIKNCHARTTLHVGLIDRFIYLFKYLIRQYSHEKFDTIFDYVVPAYGHSQALDYPDFPYLVWAYEYDCSSRFHGDYKLAEVDNRDRYERAFQGMIKHLKRFIEKHPQYRDDRFQFKDIKHLLQTIIFPGTKAQREENWRRVLIHKKLFNQKDDHYLVYEENKWLKEAFGNFDPYRFNERRVENAELADHFSQSHWYGFYQAVKWYKKKFFQYCSQYGLDIPR